MNKFNVRRVFAITILTTTVVAATQAKASSEDSPGTWVAFSAGGNLDTNKLFKLDIKEENRFTKKHLSEVHSQISLGYKVTDWFEIAPRIHSIYARNDSLNGRKKGSGNGYVDHGWERELRVGADGTFSYTLAGFKLSDRNRVVWREYEDDHGFWRYRNRIQVVTPWKWTQYKINPYTSYEVFFDDGKPSKDVRRNDKFDQWRFIIGAKAKLSDNWSLDAYYLLQEKKDTGEHEWSGHHIIGVGLAYKF